MHDMFHSFHVFQVFLSHRIWLEVPRLLSKPSELYNITEAAGLCGISRVTLWRWIKSGKLKAYQTPSGHFRIKKADLEGFIQKSLSYLDLKIFKDSNRILIVDDDPPFRKLVRRILSKDQYMIEEAPNGFEAGLKIMKFNPAILILDLYMPGIDGFEICRQIKRDEKTRSIKIIAVTGHGTLETEEKIKRLGADTYFKKPIEKKAFLQCIEDLLIEKDARTKK